MTIVSFIIPLGRNPSNSKINLRTWVKFLLNYDQIFKNNLVEYIDTLLYSYYWERKIIELLIVEIQKFTLRYRNVN